MKTFYSIILCFLFFQINITAQWFAQNSGFPNEPFFACYFLDNQNGWVVGGRQLKTTNGGINWIDKSPIPIGFGNWAYSVFFFDNLKGFIGGYNKLYRTTNGGDSWSVVYSFPYYGYNANSIYFIDSNRGWIVGGYPWEYGNFLGYTEDGGLTWSEIPIPTDNCLLSLAFSDSLHGFAVGYDGFMMKTTDGGYNWFQSSFGTDILKSIQFISESNGWMTGYAGVYRTTNGGLNWVWHLVQPNVYGTYETVFFVDSLHGYTSSYDNIFYSSDGGISWIKIDDRGVYSLFFTSQLEGWGVGGSGLILHTSNGGGIPVELISFTASPNNNKVQINWSTASELNNHGFEIERSTNKNDWLTIGFKEGKGTTTEQQNYSYTDDVNGINVTKLYYRLKQIDFDGSYEYSDIVEVAITPIKFSLSQNYPNPFNPSTKISWQSPVRSHQTLKVYDVLGREVATLVNEYRDAGSYEVEYQSAVGNRQLASGVYYYQLRIGNFVQTKKMQVIK